MMISSLRSSWRVVGSVALLLVVILAVGCSKAEEAPKAGSGSAPGPGAQVYQAKCNCHGTEGKGGGGPALNQVVGRSDEDLIKVVRDGDGRMPAFGSQLSEEQLKAVVAHIKTFKP